MLVHTTHPFWCTPKTDRILKRHRGRCVKDFYDSHGKTHAEAIEASRDPIRELENMYTETTMLIEDAFISAAKKANHSDVKVVSMLGRGKKLKQTLREGSSTRQKVGSPQMKYSMVIVADPTETHVQLNHRGFWEITHDDKSGNLRRGDLVHEASVAWGNHTRT